jgi:hypothetical protein
MKAKSRMRRSSVLARSTTSRSPPNFPLHLGMARWYASPKIRRK